MLKSLASRNSESRWEMLDRKEFPLRVWAGTVGRVSFVVGSGAGQGWKGFQDRWNTEMVIKVSGDVYPLMTGTVSVWRAL